MTTASTEQAVDYVVVLIQSGKSGPFFARCKKKPGPNSKKKLVGKVLKEGTDLADMCDFCRDYNRRLRKERRRWTRLYRRMARDLIAPGFQAWAKKQRDKAKASLDRCMAGEIVTYQ